MLASVDDLYKRQAVVLPQRFGLHVMVPNRRPNFLRLLDLVMLGPWSTMSSRLVDDGIEYLASNTLKTAKTP
jgi:hypothetical protein